MDERKRSGQIPAFGDWDRANELPITQYFESARQAGLIRFSNSSGECDKYMRGDLYSTDFKKPNYDNNYNNLAPPRKGRVLKEKKGVEAHVKEQKKQRKVCDVIDTPRKHHHRQHQQNYYMSNYDDVNNNASVIPPRPRYHVRNPKPVDEDLYKIPPELLRNSKRKKVPGFFSCLVPACAS